MDDTVALLGLVVTFDLGALIWLTAGNLTFTIGWALWIQRDEPWGPRLLMAVGVLTLSTIIGFAVMSWAADVPVRDLQVIVLGGRSP